MIFLITPPMSDCQVLNPSTQELQHQECLKGRGGPPSGPGGGEMEGNVPGCRQKKAVSHFRESWGPARLPHLRGRAGPGSVPFCKWGGQQIISDLSGTPQLFLQHGWPAVMLRPRYSKPVCSLSPSSREPSHACRPHSTSPGAPTQQAPKPPSSLVISSHHARLSRSSDH